MTKPTSLLERVIAASAEHLADVQQVSAANRSAFCQTVQRVVHSQFAAERIGESAWLRVYVARELRVESAKRRQRILQALRAGEHPRVIARRENVSPSWVHRLAKAPPEA